MPNNIIYDFKIDTMLEEGWKKFKKNNYYIFLRKDGIERKVSLSSGEILSSEKVKERKLQTIK
ncbi:MAG: hypothetical protein WCI41_01675 [bacterium]